MTRPSLLLAVILSCAAGAEAQDTPPAQAPLPYPSADVMVSVEAHRDGTALHDTDGARVCLAPCEVALLRGSQRFGLALAGSDLHYADPVYIGGPGTLHVRYVENGDLRAAGWVTFALIVGSGVAAMIAGGVMLDSYDGAGSPAASILGWSFVFAGGLQGALGVAVSLPMIFAGDGAVVRFE